MGNEIWSIYCDQTHYKSNIKSLMSTRQTTSTEQFQIIIAQKKKCCALIIFQYMCFVFSFILSHFPNISKNPKGSLKQLVDNKNIYYQLFGINPSIFRKWLIGILFRTIMPVFKNSKLVLSLLLLQLQCGLQLKIAMATVVYEGNLILNFFYLFFFRFYLFSSQISSLRAFLKR